MTSVICDNCEQEAAKWCCQACQSQNNYCDKCRKLHSKLKAFRTHIHFLEVSKEVCPVSCGNCEKAVAKFECQQCMSESERFFCLGCSLFHNKIKAFRHHTLKPFEVFDGDPNHHNKKSGWIARILEPITDELSPHIDRLGTLIQDLIDGKTDASIEMKIIITVSAVAVFLLCKYLFGSSSMVVNMGAVGGIYYYLQKRKEQQLREKQSMLQNGLFTAQNSNKKKEPIHRNEDIIIQSRPFVTNSNTVRGAVVLDELESEFPDEFPYPLHGKQASLRKRGRPYQPRPSINNSSPGKNTAKPRAGEDSDSDDMVAPSKAKSKQAITTSSRL